MQKTIASLALVALLAGCSGGASSISPVKSGTVASGALRTPHYNGGPGTTTLTYYATWAPTGPCNPGVLTLMNYYVPATSLHFAAGDGPPLVVSLCNFTTPQYGSPFIRQVDYTVTVDAPDSAKVVATWTALGPTLPGTPGTSGSVSYTI